MAGSWKILENYYEQGLIKNIGVSNFNENHLKRLEQTANIAPAVDQIEICPFLVQKDTVDYCQGQGIIVEAWGPLGKGKQLGEPEIIKLAEKYKNAGADHPPVASAERHRKPPEIRSQRADHFQRRHF